jgi:hypothetical protein
MWKLIYDSVRGTSHERTGQVCQDHAFGSSVRAGDHTILIVACSDGAGTAEHADVGSRLACEGIVRIACADLEAGLTVAAIDRERVLRWHTDIRHLLDQEAAARGVPIRQLAATLLTAVVGEENAAFAQIGDGAIVLGQGDGYEAVFWPQTGEYANMTNFLSDESFQERIEFACRPGRINELALFTDGMQSLALWLSEKRVHAPFFRPMFQALAQATDSATLMVPLRQFLSSGQVNERTDDDKTLMLATRQVSDDVPYVA